MSSDGGSSPTSLSRIAAGDLVTITIHLGALLAPDIMPAVRAGLVDKLWEHGVTVRDVVIATGGWS